MFHELVEKGRLSTIPENLIQNLSKLNSSSARMQSKLIENDICDDDLEHLQKDYEAFYMGLLDETTIPAVSVSICSKHTPLNICDQEQLKSICRQLASISINQVLREIENHTAQA